MSDLISRQAAIEAIMGEPTDAHYLSWYAERLEKLPSAQQERIIYGNMSDEEFEKWLYGHGICSPNIHESIPCDAVPLLIDNAISELPSAQPEKVYLATVTLTDEQVKEAVEEAKNAALSVIKSEPHWTPCSEELPKENGHYLVTFHQTATEEDLGFDMDDTDVRKMRYDTKHGWRTPRRIPSWINDAVVSTVLAWMPLPEPYPAEGE